jgi:hypothetical protein
MPHDLWFCGFVDLLSLKAARISCLVAKSKGVFPAHAGSVKVSDEGA